MTGFVPRQVSWLIGHSRDPRGAGELWCRWDRTAGVVGPQGSGKTLDLLIPALLAAPGAALVTLTNLRTCSCHCGSAQRTTARASSLIRSDSRQACPNWRGTRSLAVSTR
jgi:hypothetical protein